MFAWLRRYALLTAIPISLAWDPVVSVDGYRLIMCPPGGPERLCEVHDTGTATTWSGQVDGAQQQTFLVQSYRGSETSRNSDPVYRPPDVSQATDATCTATLAQCEQRVREARKTAQALVANMQALQRVITWIEGRPENHVLRKQLPAMQRHMDVLEALKGTLTP